MIYTAQDLIDLIMYLDLLYKDSFYYINPDGSMDTFYYEARECEFLKRKYLKLLESMYS